MEATNERVCSFLEGFAATLSNSDDTELLDTLREQMQYFLSADERCKAFVDITNKTVDGLSTATTAAEASALVEDFNKSMKEAEKIEARNHERLTNLGIEGEEEEICMVKSSKNVIDPISKKRLVNPVKNTVCGHVYEKDIVLQLIKKNPRTRCPIAGCSSAFIEKRNLVADDDMLRILTQPLNETAESERSFLTLDDTQ